MHENPRNAARGILLALPLSLLLWLVIGCALFSNRWAVPGSKHLRPCVGTAIYPDSANVCADTTHQEE